MRIPAMKILFRAVLFGAALATVQAEDPAEKGRSFMLLQASKIPSKLPAPTQQKIAKLIEDAKEVIRQQKYRAAVQMLCDWRSVAAPAAGRMPIRLGNEARAKDELARAAIGGGKEIFADEDPKYWAYISKILKPPPGGW